MKTYILLIVSFLPLVACSNVYFSALEKIGIEKRDLMLTRIKATKESQEEAKKEFKNALEQYKSIVKVKHSNLEDTYNKLNSVLEGCEEKAADVKYRVSQVKEVSMALFKEWKNELSEYSDARLREDSEKKLSIAKDHYSKMMASMRIASDKLDPALKPLRDKVLYLKHNLNAQAIDSLDGEVEVIETRVEELIEELSQAIEDADKFTANAL